MSHFKLTLEHGFTLELNHLAFDIVPTRFLKVVFQSVDSEPRAGHAGPLHYQTIS